MKRIFSLLLAVCLCIIFCACGRTADHLYSKGKDKQNANEQDADNNIEDFPSSENGTASGSHISDHTWMQYLYGQWRYHEKFGLSDNGIDTLTILDNGQLTIAATGGSVLNYTWWVNESQSNESRLVIDYDTSNETSSTEHRCFILSKRQYGVFVIDMGDYFSDDEIFEYPTGLYNIAYYKEIEINNDTIAQYFYDSYTYKTHTNSFGEVTGYSLYRQFSLKDNYYMLNSANDIALEYTWKTGRVDCSVDFQSQQHTITGQPQDIQEHSRTDTLDYMLTYFDCYYDSDSGCFYDYFYDINIIRSKGVLKILEIPQ